MIACSLVPAHLLETWQVKAAPDLHLTEAELHYLYVRVSNDAVSASLPPGDGTVHAAPFAPQSERVDLNRLATTLCDIYAYIKQLNKANNPKLL